MLRDLLTSTAIRRAPADEPGGAAGGDANGAAGTGAADAPPAAADSDGQPPASQRVPTSLLEQAEDSAAKPEGDGDGAKPEDKPGDDDAAKKEGDDGKAAEPPDYAALELPAGLTKDGPIFASFVEAVGKAGLPLEATKAIVDGVGPELAKALEAPYELWADTQEKWGKEAAADPEIGGEAFKQNLGIARKGIAHFAGAETAKVLEALTFTGAANNPEVLRVFFRIGKAVSEGSYVAGGTPRDPKPLASKMYPDMANQS